MSLFKKIFYRKPKKPSADDKDCEKFKDCQDESTPPAEATLEELLNDRHCKKETLLNKNAALISDWVLEDLAKNIVERRAEITQRCVGHVSKLKDKSATIPLLENCKISTKLSQRVNKYLFQSSTRVGNLLKTDQNVVCKVSFSRIDEKNLIFSVYFLFPREMYPGDSLFTYPGHVFRCWCTCDYKKPTCEDDESDDEPSYDCGCRKTCNMCKPDEI